MRSIRQLRAGARCPAGFRPLLLAAWLLAAVICSDAALVLPISFTPVPVDSGVLYPMFANTSLDGVFVTGLQFGTSPQTLQLLIDTGSGITHVAGRGCGSSCGVGLSPAAGYDAQASSTAQRLPCDERCSCPQCECQTQGVEEPYCVFRIAYAMGDSSSGSLWTDKVDMASGAYGNVSLTFGVQERQTGKIAAMNIEGLLALDRSRDSFLGQMRAQNLTDLLAFSTCWEVDYQGSEQGYPSTNATSFLMLGLPEAVMAEVQPQWTPLLGATSQHEWRVGLEAIEVEGPVGGEITAEFFQPTLPSNSNSSSSSGESSSGSSSSSSGGGGSGGSDGLGIAAELQYAPAIIDSGTTFVRLPRAAWKQFQQLIINATEAMGEADHVQAAEAGTCWKSHVPGALFNNATALASAFPTIRFRFQGGAEFAADPRGYLTSPRANDDRFACLSFFPWPQTTAPSLSGLTLIGSRVRQNVLTLHDDTSERVGFAQVGDCTALAERWAEARAGGTPAASAA